jgi:hypothetical protein
MRKFTSSTTLKQWQIQCRNFLNYIDPIISKRKGSATLVMNELMRTLTQQGKKIYRFGFGQSPFPVPKKMVQELQANAFQKDYLPV